MSCWASAMAGTVDGRRGFWDRRALAGTSSSGGQHHRNVEGSVQGPRNASCTHPSSGYGAEESRQRPPSQSAEVQYCRRQYDVLVTYIRYALRCWAPQDEAPLSYWMDATVSPWTGSSAIQVTPELRRVLTRAKILCDECCRELPPLKAALRHSKRSEAFADVLTEIQWCSSVVHSGSIWKNLQDRWAPEPRSFPWQARLGRQEQQLLQRAEQEDWLELMQELERWNPGHQCSGEECGNIHAQGDPEYCLSTQILARFRAQKWRFAHGYGSFLWSFHKEVLGHGPLLGSGAFGAVSEVTWLGCKYAQKVFNPAGLHSLRDERDALAKMNHPHIVKVYAYSEDSLLMDLMAMDLRKFMEMRRRKRPSMAGPFSLVAAIDLMLQIADAVSHMHSRKLAHRDLKSSNILVNPLNIPGLDGDDDDDDDDGFVFAKIADFGLAKVKREITRNSHLTHNVGSKKWMAPEISGANLEDDPLEVAYPMKTDVYSFGVLCYEILSGEEPYSGVPLTELYAKLTAIFPLRPLLPASCPTGLASLICACWDADPQKRPAFADVCRVLRYLKGLPTLIDLGERWSLVADLGRRWSLVADWPYGRLRAKMKMEGPFGSHAVRYSTPFIPLPGVEKIQGFRVEFSDRAKRELLTFEFASDPFRDFYAPDPERSTGWILFDQPSEFLVQVEGSFEHCERPLVRADMTTVTFITTTRKYGPFGTAREGDERFGTNPGRIVGSAGLPGCGKGPLIFSVIPEIVQCLRHYLENEDPFA